MIRVKQDSLVLFSKSVIAISQRLCQDFCQRQNGCRDFEFATTGCCEERLKKWAVLGMFLYQVDRSKER